MTESKRYIVSEEQEGKRLDIVLAGLPGIGSRAFGERLIGQGAVDVDGSSRSKGYRLKAGECVEWTVPDVVESPIAAEPVDFEVVHEDEFLAVVSKPAGVVVHPAPGHSGGTLVNGLLDRLTGLSSIGGERRPGIVHRLDKETSGLMMVAKDDATHRALSAQLKSRLVKRGYIALVVGRMPWTNGDIDAPIGRDPRDRKQMAVVAGGKPSKSFFVVTEELSGHTLLDVSLSTGRTHQIRVHLSHLGFPVFGDGQYGSLEPAMKRHFLHAATLTFEHPKNGDSLHFRSPLPDELEVVLESMRGA